MCRMLAAAGRFDVAPLIEGLRAMASNDNPPHRHEYTERGSEYVHADGWGAVWEEDGRLRTARGTIPCFDDPALDTLTLIETDRLVLHARRGTGDAGVSLENTHPFAATHMGAEWAYCHNGAVRNTTRLRRPEGLLPRGGTDSELLFLHILAGVDPSDIAGSLSTSLGDVADFTCLNSLLVTGGRVLYAAHPERGTGRPRYYTLWKGRCDGFSVVSSEPLPGLAAAWEPFRSGVAELTPP